MEEEEDPWKAMEEVILYISMYARRVLNGKS